MKSFQNDPFANDKSGDAHATASAVPAAAPAGASATPPSAPPLPHNPGGMPPGGPTPPRQGRGGAVGLAIAGGVAALAIAGGAVAAIASSQGGGDPVPVDSTTDGSGDGVAADGRTVVTVQSWGFLGIDLIADEFMDENPDIVVEVLEEEFVTHHENMLDEIVFGNDGPTIALIDDDYLPGFAERRDDLVNLLDYGADSLEPAVVPWRWNQTTTVDGDVIFGIAYDMQGQAICYRADLLDAAGLPSGRDEVAALTSTWDDFTAFATQYTENTGKPFLDTTEVLAYVLLQQDGPAGLFHDIDGELDLAKAREGLDLTVQYLENALVATDELWSDEWYETLGSDGYAANLCPFWLLTSITSEMPIGFDGQWDIAPLPGIGGNWGGSSFIVPKYDDADERAAEIEAAYDFIEFALSEQIRQAVHWDYGILPSEPGMSNDPKYTGWELEEFSDALAAETFGAAAEAIRDEMFLFDGHYDISGAYWQMLTDVRVFGEDPEESWDDFVELAERIDRLAKN